MHLLCYYHLCDGTMRIYICICLYVHKETLIGFAENNDGVNLGDLETK